MRAVGQPACRCPLAPGAVALTNLTGSATVRTDDDARLGAPWVGEEDDIARLAKVSLHDHLDGSLRPETFVELIRAQGDAAVLPSTDATEVERWLRGQSGDIWAHHDVFALLCSVMQTREQIERCAAEYVSTCVADGVVYAETRWAPEKHLRRGLTLDDAVEAVAAGLQRGIETAAADGHEIVVRQLLCVMRTTRPSTDIVELAIRSREVGVVGVDLAGVEDGFPASDHVDAFRLAAAAGLPATVHAGEGDGAQSVWDAVTSCHARRIGHGTRVVEDIAFGGRCVGVVDAVEVARAGQAELGACAAFVRDRRTVLEQCPSSNASWVVPNIEAHPIDLLRRLGFAVTVNPDNRMLSGTSVTSELRLLRDAFGWTTDDFADVTRTALAAAFCDDDTRRRVGTMIG
jgi:adenosine deaminase